MKSIKTNEK